MWIIRGFLLIPLALACFALSPTAQAVDPPPDGGYLGGNTAEGDYALAFLTDGVSNTAIGYDVLGLNTSGSFNTATGVNALTYNETGDNNTANGAFALLYNLAGNNTATGAYALYSNDTGSNNTANGYQAMYGDSENFSSGGSDNTATGAYALYSLTTGSFNTANGFAALYSNTTGSNNTASGYDALLFNTGSNNTGLGSLAGGALTTGSDNIDIGHSGFAGDSAKIRIGTKGTHKNTYIAGIYGATATRGIGVFIDSNGHLGTATSSARFKDAIKPMDKASEAILALKPVTFHYKKELDPDGTPQFGLVAEQVEKVNPDLVARDDQGKPYTVRYEAVNAMLLNEFLKEHRRVEEQARISQQQETTIAQQKQAFESRLAEQQKEIKGLTVALKEQAAEIHKVSDQIALSRPAPRVVSNHP